jgi:dihydrofolate reductase
MILGANTYAQAKGYWPYADDQGEYGEKLNNLTKFVASSKLDDAPWGDFPAATVTRDPAATIRELKEQSGKDIWLWGSLKLMHSLLDAGVVDEVPDAGLPGVTRQGNAHFRGLARPEAGRGHLVRKRRGTSALRDQEISGKSALSKNRTPAMLLVLGIGRHPLFRYRLPAVQ